MSDRKAAVRSDWCTPTLRVCFETTSMRVKLRNGKTQTRKMVTPVFRLPNGIEFTGRRISPWLRGKVEESEP